MFNEGLTMDHYISVIFAKQLNESKRDIVLDTMINTARVGLTESSVEYELYENDSNTILRLPLAKPIKEDHQQAFVEHWHRHLDRRVLGDLQAQRLFAY